MLQIGSLIEGKYKILHKIGQGGMSTVYLAINEKANKQWAVKEVRNDGRHDFETVRRSLTAETDLMKKLKHPGLPSIVDVIDEDGSFLIVMDYIEGKPLSSLLQEPGPGNLPEVVDWGIQLCDVLGYLHSRKPPVIYRDMKPGNIMLKPDGKIVLIDFGTAREYKEGNTSDTAVLGTRGYAAPEQYGGLGQTDARTDIYGLGATLYHLLTGWNPAGQPGGIDPFRQWRPGMDPGVQQIIWKCTRPDPADRYQSCGEVRYALEHYREQDSGYRRMQMRRWRLFLAALAAAVSAGAGAAGFHGAEKVIRAGTYTSWISDAEKMAATDPAESERRYIRAVGLDPSREEAYTGLLDLYCIPGEGEEQILSFSCAEELKLRRVLGMMGDNPRSNQSYLAENLRGYRKFAYELGRAYFYCYEGRGNKAASSKWLEIAAEEDRPGQEGGLGETEVRRARCLYRIADYYKELGVWDPSGESKATYGELWRELAGMAVWEAENGTFVSKLMIFRELAAQVHTNASEFRAAGVGRDEMEQTLDFIRGELRYMERIRNGENAEDKAGNREAALRSAVSGSLELAGQHLEAVFGTKDPEGG